MEIILQSVVAVATIIGTGLAIMTFVSNRLDKRTRDIKDHVDTRSDDLRSHVDKCFDDIKDLIGVTRPKPDRPSPPRKG